MDPLTAFGLVCNVIQVVDFGLKTISKCREIALRGATAEIIDAEYVTNHVKDLNVELTKHLTASSSQPVLASDVQLKKLAEQCKETAEEFLKEVKKLNLDPAASKNKFKVFSKTMETIWKRGTLEEIQEKLERL